MNNTFLPFFCYFRISKSLFFYCGVKTGFKRDNPFFFDFFFALKNSFPYILNKFEEPTKCSLNFYGNKNEIMFIIYESI